MARILIPTPLRPYTDKQDAVDAAGATVGELLADLTSKHSGLKNHLYNEQGKLRSFVNIYVNDEDIRYLQKEQTPVSSGDTVSIREYGSWQPIWDMIARCAFAQLGYSAPALVGTVAGMALVYLAPPVLLLLGPAPARVFGAAAWAGMSAAFVPILRLYRCPVALAPLRTTSMGPNRCCVVTSARRACQPAIRSSARTRWGVPPKREV